MIEVIDNFLPEEMIDEIYDTMTDGNFHWYLQNNVADNTYQSNDWYFYHVFYNKKLDNPENSIYYNKWINKIVDKIGAVDLMRVKANFYPNQNKFFEHDAHIDYNTPHKGAILYLNTCNGFTRLINGKKIESVKNRLLLFEPYYLHNSTNTTDKPYRLNINFNFKDLK